ncbi:MAG TPA: YceH family protein [Terriglobia bacterium]|nr:YceH family protein [Terriglobia bacterium]
MNIQLNDVEGRVLGALVEKEITTPDYYPLSLNALINACNQRSNRDPVLSLSEGEVTAALESLQQKGLARPVTSFDSRVPKYGNQLAEVFNFDRRETAVLCVLLLRGPQTPGELRGRTERLYAFDDLTAVEAILHRLTERDPPLVRQLPRQPGTKESRWTHLLAREVEAWTPPAVTRESPAADDRLMRLETEVEELRKEVAELRQQLSDFRKQFD